MGFSTISGLTLCLRLEHTRIGPIEISQISLRRPAETGQMSVAETGQMQHGEAGQRPCLTRIQLPHATRRQNPMRRSVNIR